MYILQLNFFFHRLYLWPSLSQVTNRDFDLGNTTCGIIFQKFLISWISVEGTYPVIPFVNINRIPWKFCSLRCCCYNEAIVLRTFCHIKDNLLSNSTFGWHAKPMTKNAARTGASAVSSRSPVVCSVLLPSNFRLVI